MNDQPGTSGISPSAKKSVVFILVIAALGMMMLFLFAKGCSKKTKIIREGDRAPEFTLSSLDGKRVSLSSFQGKVVMVHFWATWCPPCVDEMPTLEKLYREAAMKDFEIMAVSVDGGGAASVQPFLQRNRLTLPVLLDPDRSVSGLYGTFKFPETYILDRNGVVRYKVIGPADWTAPLNLKILRELVNAR